MSGSLTLVELAALLARYRRVELALFEALGSAATKASTPELVLALATASRSHGFRACLVEALLPLEGTPAGSAVGPPSEHERSLTAGLEAMDAEGLAAVASRVWYPAMLVGYRRHCEHATSPGDGPTRRLLQRLISDLEHVGDELRAVADGRPELEGVAAAELGAAGGPFGAEPWAPVGSDR